jgi:hypothetical protein
MGGQEAARWAAFFVFVASRRGEDPDVRQFISLHYQHRALRIACDRRTCETRTESETGMKTMKVRSEK